MVSGTVRAVGPMRVRPAEAEGEEAGRSSGAQACTIGHQSLGKDIAKAGSASIAESPGNAAAHQLGHEQNQAPLQGSSTNSAKGHSARCLSAGKQQQQLHKAAAEVAISAAPMELAGVPGVGPDVLVLDPVGQAAPGPEPSPSHPARVLAAQAGLKKTSKLCCMLIVCLSAAAGSPDDAG